MKSYQNSFHATNIELLSDKEFEKLPSLFTQIETARQFPFLYNHQEKIVLTKSDNAYNLFDIFEKKLWASIFNPSFDITGYKMYVILNKSVVKKYSKNFGVKFDIVATDDKCDEVWSSQKIEAWDLDHCKEDDIIENQGTL